MAVETARKRGRPKKTDAEAGEVKKTVPRNDEPKSAEKRARKKKLQQAVGAQVPDAKQTGGQFSQENGVEWNAAEQPSDLPVPGPMTAKILDEIRLAKSAADDMLFDVAEKEHKSANTSASSPPSKSFPSVSMPVFPQSTAHHQVAAMSTKSKPPAPSPRSSSKASPPPKTAAKSTKSTATPKPTATSSPSSTTTAAKSTPKAPSASKIGTLPTPPPTQPSQPRPSPKQLYNLATAPFANPAHASGAQIHPPPGKLPDRYKPTARRVTAIIVSLPIFLVTSWVLYERLVLGKELKQLPSIPDNLPDYLPDYLPSWLRARNRGGGERSGSGSGSGDEPVGATTPVVDRGAGVAGKDTE